MTERKSRSSANCQGGVKAKLYKAKGVKQGLGYWLRTGQENCSTFMCYSTTNFTLHYFTVIRAVLSTKFSI